MLVDPSTLASTASSPKMEFLSSKFSSLFTGAGDKSSKVAKSSSISSSLQTIVELSSGSFSYIEPLSTASIKETLVYKSATLAIVRPSSSSSHTFNLVVCRKLGISISPPSSSPL